MSNTKNIFITGPSGLIGTALLNKLKTSDFQITAIDRIRKSNNEENIKWIYDDLSNPDIDISKFLIGQDILIHNAASLKLGNNIEEKNELELVNINFSKRLFLSAIKNGVSKIIFTSTLSSLRKPLPAVILESSELSPGNDYSRSKVLIENYLTTLCKDNNVFYNILRISSPVSFEIDRMPENVVKYWIKSSIRGESIKIFGNGSRTQDFVSVTDIAKAFCLCIDNPEVTGTFNIASGNTISMMQLAEIIVKKFHNKFVFEGQDINENDRWNISIEKAKELLGYLPEFDTKSCITNLLNNIH